MLSVITSKIFWIVAGVGGLTISLGLFARKIDAWIERKRERDANHEKTEILKKQRDDGISTVADADKFWMRRDKAGR